MAAPPTLFRYSLLGPSRVEIVRQLAMEQTLVALAGGVAGLVAPRAFLPAILALDPEAAASSNVTNVSCICSSFV